jgi:hypothetical protein
MSRNGYILTTNRIIHISVWRKDTILSVCCPSFILCCFPTEQQTIVRSLFPRKVESGFIRREGRLLRGMILTNCGAIAITFDLTTQISALDYSNAESRISKRLAFLKAIMGCARSREKVLDATTLSSDAAFAGGLELAALPVVPDERLLARYSGKSSEDSCAQTCPDMCTNRNTWHPIVCQTMSCGISPYFGETAVLVSDSTVYAVKSNQNEPKCCALYLQKKSWSVFFTPLSGLAGSEVLSMLTGTETFWSRCCYGKWIGMYVCVCVFVFVSVCVCVCVDY